MEDVNGDHVFRTTDEASVALLRGLRAGTVDHNFIHRADVCSAVPEELVAGLQPVPGTEVTEDGYNSVWYIYCPKRYKNSRGEPSGHRQRSVEPDNVTGWHSETRPKPVQGVPGATFCDFSYGRMEKEGLSGRRRRLERMGWCMKEFDDTQSGGGDHVLCRVRRSSSSLAKSKFKKPSSSSSSSSKTKGKFKSSSSSSKRKAAGDHPEAPPTKLIHDEQVQQSPAAFFTDAYPTMPCYGYGPPQGVDPVTMVGELEAEHIDGGELNVEELLNMEVFANAYPTMPFYSHGGLQAVDPVTMFGGEEEEHGVQQPRVELEAEHVDGGEFNVEELLNMEELANDYPTMPTCYGHGGPQVVDPAMFGSEEEEHGVQVQQPRVESEAAEPGGDLGGFNLEELLNTDDWKVFLQMLQAEGEQGQHQLQPSAKPEQGGGIVVSGGLLYAC